jgi:hypothetical protein
MRKGEIEIEETMQENKKKKKKKKTMEQHKKKEDTCISLQTDPPLTYFVARK